MAEVLEFLEKIRRRPVIRHNTLLSMGIQTIVPRGCSTWVGDFLRPFCQPSAWVYVTNTTMHASMREPNIIWCYNIQDPSWCWISFQWVSTSVSARSQRTISVWSRCHNQSQVFPNVLLLIELQYQRTFTLYTIALHTIWLEHREEWPLATCLECTLVS